MALRWLPSAGSIVLCLACGPSSKNPSAPDGGASGAGASGRGGNAGTAGTTGGAGTSAGGGGSGNLGPDIGPVIEPGDPGEHDLTFTIRADRDVLPISPLIYGVNGGSTSCTDEVARPTVCRLGGNRWTAYNWENNASNAGRDYCFQNDGFLSDSAAPGAAVLEVLAETTEITTVLTVPIVDYVAADKLGGASGPPTCSGDVRKTGADYLSTRFKRNQALKGSAFSETPDPNDNSVYQDEFVAFIKAAAGSANVVFSLDNEPDLWAGTHAEIHPEPVTYAEVVQRNIAFARGIRATWPEAEILGFVSYGYNGYVNLQSAPDRSGKGEFIDYYLGELREAEAAEGARLVDYLDLHWYPEARGGGTRVIESSTAAETVAARVQAPRSLWDESFVEDSWIIDATNGPIRLLPRIKQKIAANYPGTKLAITEWNYGAGNHISGAIATADVLGIFGREGVALATLWPLARNESFNLAAFGMYRNYDGAGARFGDTSIHATSSDIETASVYASFDAEDPERVVIVAINRTGAEISAGITIAHPSEFAEADVFVLSSAAPEPRAAEALTTTATNAFVYTLPPESVSVIAPRR